MHQMELPPFTKEQDAIFLRLTKHSAYIRVKILESYVSVEHIMDVVIGMLKIHIDESFMYDKKLGEMNLNQLERKLKLLKKCLTFYDQTYYKTTSPIVEAIKETSPIRDMCAHWGTDTTNEALNLYNTNGTIRYMNMVHGVVETKVIEKVDVVHFLNNLNTANKVLIEICRDLLPKMPVVPITD